VTVPLRRNQPGLFHGPLERIPRLLPYVFGAAIRPGTQKYMPAVGADAQLARDLRQVIRLVHETFLLADANSGHAIAVPATFRSARPVSIDMLNGDCVPPDDLITGQAEDGGQAVAFGRTRGPAERDRL